MSDNHGRNLSEKTNMRKLKDFFDVVLIHKIYR